jgi:alanine dehydrogenase
MSVMTLGVPRETAVDEHRVSLTPAGVRTLRRDATVLVEQGAGASAGFLDDDYLQAGAELVPTAEELWDRSERVIKVQAPTLAEQAYGGAVGCFVGTAEASEGTLAWERIRFGRSAPVLRPMSEIAGRLAVLMGARALGRAAGGRGVLLGSLPGVGSSRVLVLGAGVVGGTAVRTALALGAEVTVIDVSLDALRQIEGARTLLMDDWALEKELGLADVVLGAVHVPGQRCPVVLPKEAMALMRPGSAMVDVSVDQGGCAETTELTSLSRPTRVVGGIVHVGVPNLPSAVAATASAALSHALAPYVLRLAQGETLPQS